MLAVIEIRRFQPEDSISDLTALLHRAYANLAELGLKYMATHQGDEVTKRRVERGEGYVAVQDNKFVGTIVFYSADRTNGCDWYDRPEVASFGQFGVEPSLQGRGLGKQLVDLVEARAKELGALELALDTAEPAKHLIEWYVRLGYRHVAYAQWEGVNYRSVIMSKAL